MHSGLALPEGLPSAASVSGKGTKHDNTGFDEKTEGLCLFPVPLSRFVTLKHTSPSRTLRQSTGDRTKNQPRRKGKKKRNA